ncbi:TIGR04282 family arsenosugar biosynthesis glycosyltransferase [Spirosoma arcticum]
MSNTTAILIFAQPVAHDAGRKRLGSQPGRNRRVLSELNRRVRHTAEDTNLSVLLSADLIDHSGTFGGQLTDALRAAFALGFGRVLVIGNDCPALTTTHLTQAANQLQSTPVVLGPDRRGGLYLFGLTRAVFERASIASLPWQTDRLARAVCQVCAAWPVATLPHLSDINYHDDLRHYRPTSPTVASFIAQLLRLGAAEQTGIFSTPYARPVTLYAGGTGSLRAPPAPCATAITA